MEGGETNQKGEQKSKGFSGLKKQGSNTVEARDFDKSNFRE